MKRTLSLLIAVGFLLSACSERRLVTAQVAQESPPAGPLVSQAKKELDRAKIVTVVKPDKLAEALVHELADLQRSAAGDTPLLTPDKVKVTFMSAAERSANGEVKVGLEVFGLGSEASVSASASLEEIQELSMTFDIDSQAAARPPAAAPKIEIGIAEAARGLRDELKAFIHAGGPYLIPGCTKITMHFELDTDVKTGGQGGIKFVTLNGEIDFGGHVADTLEISFKVAGHKGTCDL